MACSMLSKLDWIFSVLRVGFCEVSQQALTGEYTLCVKLQLWACASVD